MILLHIFRAVSKHLIEFWLTCPRVCKTNQSLSVKQNSQTSYWHPNDSGSALMRCQQRSDPARKIGAATRLAPTKARCLQWANSFCGELCHCLGPPRPESLARRQVFFGTRISRTCSWGRKLIMPLKLFSFQHCDDTVQVSPGKQRRRQGIFSTAHLDTLNWAKGAVCCNSLTPEPECLCLFLWLRVWCCHWDGANANLIIHLRFIPPQPVHS